MLRGMLSLFYIHFSLYFFQFYFYIILFYMCSWICSPAPEYAQTREEEFVSAHKGEFQAPDFFLITSFHKLQPDEWLGKTKYKGKCWKCEMKTLKDFHLLWNKKTQWGKKNSGKWVGEACSRNYPKLPFLEAEERFRKSLAIWMKTSLFWGLETVDMVSLPAVAGWWSGEMRAGSTGLYPGAQCLPSHARMVKRLPTSTCSPRVAGSTTCQGWAGGAAWLQSCPMQFDTTCI